MNKHLHTLPRLVSILGLACCLALPAHAGILSALSDAMNGKSNKKESADMEFDENKLDFTCTHEADHLPPVDPEADKIFKYARYLEKKKGPKDYTEIGNLYRRAARMKHYKAMGNLQNLLYQQLVPSDRRVDEAVDLVDELIKMNIPFGYYIMGTYLEEGYGVKEDKTAAMKYYRRAADLGNPDGQTAVANILSDKFFKFQLARKFYSCAVEQGHAEAAYQLALDYQTGSNRPENRYPPDYPMAAKYYQKAVEFGQVTVAVFMSSSFAQANPPTDRVDYIGFDKADPERSRRYDLIAREIDANPSARFPDIDKIVPLPPAPLPHWDGTFAYRKELEKQTPPPPPPPEPLTPKAKPVSVAPVKTPPVAVIPPVPLGTLCATGQACPETGYWEAVPPKDGLVGKAEYFTKGDMMPTKQFILPRRFVWMDDIFQLRKKEITVDWKLVEYPNISNS